MTNYIIEGGINFYDEINNLEDEKSEDTDNEKEDDLCLITNETLLDNHVKLLCKHKFNYMPLYKEIYNQKYRGYVKNLSINQLMCPLCRNIQNKLLPCIYLNDNSIPSMPGINNPVKFCMYNNNCKYKFISGKRKGQECGKECNGDYCLKHKNQIDKKCNATEFSAKNVKLKDNKTKDKNICCAIIKHGKNAGSQCKFKVKQGDYCGKHCK